MDADQLKQLVEGIIDFKGQQKVFQTTTYLAIIGVSVSGLAGIVSGDFFNVVYGLIATYVAMLILCLPLPNYNKNPVKFIDPAPIVMPE